MSVGRRMDILVLEQTALTQVARRLYAVRTEDLKEICVPDWTVTPFNLNKAGARLNLVELVDLPQKLSDLQPDSYVVAVSHRRYPSR